MEKVADQIERETAHDPSEDVSMSAYDLLPQEEREAIAWVREHGGLGAVKNMAAITLDVYQRLVDGNAGLEMLETDADTISSMMAEIDEAIVKRGKERTTALALLDESIPRVTYERHILKRQRQIDESHAALRRKSERIGFLVSELNRANNENHEMFIRRAGDYTAFADEVCKRLAPELRYVEGCSKDVMDAALHALDRRLMPEGMEWPRFEDGEPVRVGDRLAQMGDGVLIELDDPVDSVTFYGDGMVELHGDMNTLALTHGERVKRIHEMQQTLNEALPAAKWVKSHGGLKECDRKVEASMEVADKYTLLRMELGKLLGYDLMGQLDATDEELVEKIGKRLMPEGMEWLLDVWPKWSNGEYCKFGDWWKAEKYGEREPQQLRRLAFFTPEQLREWGQDEGENFGYEWDYMRPSDTTYRPDKVEPPAPKVLDADGVEIRAGDTVYDMVGDKHVVKGFGKQGDVLLEFHNDESLGWRPSNFTHRSPVFAADGKRILKGDVLYDRAGNRFEVLKNPENDQHVIANFTDEDGKAHRTFTKALEFTHDKPVLAADGLALREGETVWGTKGGSYHLTSVHDGKVFARYVGGSFGTEVESAGGEGLYRLRADQLTHGCPAPSDSWERLEEDAARLPFEYYALILNWTMVTEMDDSRLIEGMTSDLVRRAKTLAGDA